MNTLVLAVLATLAALAVLVGMLGVIEYQPNNEGHEVLHLRFSETAFGLNDACKNPAVNDEQLSTSEYSHGLLAMGAFRDNKYPVEGAAARGTFICLNVTVPFMLDGINNAITAAILETCNDASENLAEVYINADGPVLSLQHLDVVVVPVIDTSQKVDNITFQQHDPIIGTAHKCKKG